VYQKLLKLDNPSSSYGKKIKILCVFMPHSVYVAVLQSLVNDMERAMLFRAGRGTGSFGAGRRPSEADGV